MVQSRQSFLDRFEYGKINIKSATDAEDQKEGIDGWIDDDIPMASRKRKKSIAEYGEISIRDSIYYPNNEYGKLINGKFRSKVYIFGFLDAIVICNVTDIIDCLVSENFRKVPNPDKETWGLYIKLQNIKHILIWK